MPEPIDLGIILHLSVDWTAM